MIHITYVPNANKNLKKLSKILKSFMKKQIINYINHKHRVINIMIQNLNKNKSSHLDLKFLDFIMDFPCLLINSTNKKLKSVIMSNKSKIQFIVKKTKKFNKVFTKKDLQNIHNKHKKQKSIMKDFSKISDSEHNFH